MIVRLYLFLLLGLFFVHTNVLGQSELECRNLIAAEKITKANVEMYTTVWDQILNEGNLDLFNSDHFDPNVNLVSSPDDIKGIESVKAFYNNYITGFSDRSFTIIRMFGQGDNLVKHWRFKGKHTGELFGIPATNKQVDINGVTLIVMKNGKIFEEQDFMDNMDLMNQLGLLPDNY